MRSIQEFKGMCEVSKTGCWLYPHVRANGNIYYMYYYRDEYNLDFSKSRGKNPKGRGRVRRIDVRRWMYSNLVGYLSKNTILVDICGEPSCINPAHMKTTTITKSKLSEKDIMHIFTDYASAPFPSIMALSRKYNVSPSTLYDIQSGRNWKQLHDKVMELVKLRNDRFYGLKS